MKTHSRKCSSVCGAAKKMRARALLADRLERELLGVDVEPARRRSNMRSTSRSSANFSYERRQAALEPAGRVQHEVAAREVGAPERHRRLRRRLGVERVGGRQAAAAAERQAVAARELAAGERAEHRLGHARATARRCACRRRRRTSRRSTRRRAGSACAIATPESASATCSESPAATETGAVAPASRNGVIAIGWLASAQAHIASTMRKSQTSGLLGLTTPMIAGSASIAARPAARDRGEVDAVARARSRRAVGDVGLVRVADPGVVEIEVPARLGHVGGLAGAALAAAQKSASPASSSRSRRDRRTSRRAARARGRRRTASRRAADGRACRRRT